MGKVPDGSRSGQDCGEKRLATYSESIFRLVSYSAWHGCTVIDCIVVRADLPLLCKCFGPASGRWTRNG
jgi:hypothetical protein